ncbi:MAG: gamma-glutamylcyclotransferase family protein [Bacteroidota bacterium]
MIHLFVYGTLLSDIPSSMSKFLRRRGKLIGKASVAGTLYDMGMYPGFVAGGSGTVKGELYRLEGDNAKESLSMIDAYESVTGAGNDEYRRITIKGRVSDGGPFEAFTYEIRKKPRGMPEIPRGNYSAFFKGNKEHQRFVNGG